jgi:hypothetical protein
MFDFDELFKGYSNSDEFIARDMLILELLIAKGVITNEDVAATFTPENLTKNIELVQKTKREQAERKLAEYKEGSSQ